ncbi:MAG: hypothetical protein AABY22_08980 [Nanoarchaeota archaeon]
MSLKDFLEGFKKGQVFFGESIAFLINTVLLTIVYFVGVGLTSIIAKIFGKGFIDMKTDPQTGSYWKELNLDKKPIQYYYRQF